QVECGRRPQIAEKLLVIRGSIDDDDIFEAVKFLNGRLKRSMTAKRGAHGDSNDAVVKCSLEQPGNLSLREIELFCDLTLAEVMLIVQTCHFDYHAKLFRTSHFRPLPSPVRCALYLRAILLWSE